MKNKAGKHITEKSSLADGARDENASKAKICLFNPLKLRKDPCKRYTTL